MTSVKKSLRPFLGHFFQSKDPNFKCLFSKGAISNQRSCAYLCKLQLSTSLESLISFYSESSGQASGITFGCCHSLLKNSKNEARKNQWGRVLTLRYMDFFVSKGLPDKSGDSLEWATFALAINWASCTPPGLQDPNYILTGMQSGRWN